MSVQIPRPREHAPSIGDTRLLIDGQRVDALSGATFATVDPSTGAELAQVAEGRSEDVDRAVEAFIGVGRSLGVIS